jgi:hypothetical protein
MDFKFKPIFINFYIPITVWIIILLTFYGFSDNKRQAKLDKMNRIEAWSNIQQTDTCIIEGMAFEIPNNGEIKGLRAIIKNCRLKIISSNNGKKDYRVIRYVFSNRRDDNYSSVRNYGDLVSYPVVNLLKLGETGDLFYFEEIIIVDPSKLILIDALKPIILKKL